MSEAEREGAGLPALECYQMGTALEPVEPAALSAGRRGLTVIWTAREDAPLPAGVMPPSPKGARFSRAEGRRDCLCGAMVIPGRPPFGYAVTADTVVLLDSGGTVRPCLKQMEKGGLIRRVPVEYDARLKKIELTDYAEEVKQQLERQVRRTERQLTEGFSEEELDAFFSYVCRFQENLAKIE